MPLPTCSLPNPKPHTLTPFERCVRNAKSCRDLDDGGLQNFLVASMLQSSVFVFRGRLLHLTFPGIYTISYQSRKTNRLGARVLSSSAAVPSLGLQGFRFSAIWGFEFYDSLSVGFAIIRPVL